MEVVVAAVVVAAAVVAVAADSHLRDALPLGPLHVQAQLLVRAGRAVASENCAMIAP